MAGHDSLTSFVATSLLEYLVLSRLALEHVKDESWHPEDRGGPLGTASALVLLCVVDAIGGYLRYGSSVAVIDGKQRKIDGEKSKHFFVLNVPEYYGQDLSLKEIESIYEYRNLLAHNAALAAGRPLLFHPADPQIFPVFEDTRAINLPALHNQSTIAVARLLSAENLIEESHAAKNIRLKTAG
jgi:hypothetical protein